MKHKRKSKKSRKILLTIGVILGILILAGGGYAYFIYHSLEKTADKIYKPINGKDKNKNLPLQKNRSTAPPINILLLGVDERPHDKGRSDTMIIATLNPKTNSMLMTSIPRDTRVQIPGHTGYSKINAAYAYGDEPLAVQTVEKYFNINIPYYVKVNMQGLADLVDAVGGVTVHNDITWADEGYYKKGYVYKKGDIFLDGKKALGYVRMRHKDPRGDFGRNIRQRQVIQAVLQKGKSFTSITKMTSILNVLGKNVTTNLTFDDMKRLATDYRDCQNHIIDYETKGTPKYMDGVSWVIVTDEEFQNVHNMIEKQMNAQ
ncbi:LCP family glycopolymer transferase [Caenibacillus caldisaponilyticus]|uniref:LCP family glycopolymer transferase n=1 Tax=Caenibacillus caldisaponilyticus TaxID=1674942 RepID=UPI000988790E|nr:LCP family protein [Caenibacillus caldisaponilyticus]